MKKTAENTCQDSRSLVSIPGRPYVKPTLYRLSNERSVFFVCLVNLIYIFVNQCARASLWEPLIFDNQWYITIYTECVFYDFWSLIFLSLKYCIWKKSNAFLFIYFFSSSQLYCSRRCERNSTGGAVISQPQLPLRHGHYIFFISNIILHSTPPLYYLSLIIKKSYVYDDNDKQVRKGTNHRPGTDKWWFVHEFWTPFHATRTSFVFVNLSPKKISIH